MMRIVSAPDALDVGAAMDLPSFDERRTMVRLAGAPSLYDGGAGNQVAQLVLSMPFPNQGEVHVGSDLAEALQAYLGGQVQPASGSLFAPSVAAGGALGAGGVMFKLRGGEGDGLPLDWSGLHLQASQKAQDAIITLDLPSVQPLLAGSSSVSGLPLLLQRALAQSGDWTPGPGAPMPAAIREMALRRGRSIRARKRSSSRCRSGPRWAAGTSRRPTRSWGRRWRRRATRRRWACTGWWFRQAGRWT